MSSYSWLNEVFHVLDRCRAGGYLTFRVMIEGSSGWIVPAKPGLHIVQAVAAEAETWSPEIISRAVQAAVGR